jgi:hypothetical protein
MGDREGSLAIAVVDGMHGGVSLGNLLGVEPILRGQEL